MKYSTKVLEILASKVGKSKSGEILFNIEAGFKHEVKQRRKKGLDTDAGYLLKEVRGNTKFLAVCARLGISIDDFERIASKCVEDSKVEVVNGIN